MNAAFEEIDRRPTHHPFYHGPLRRRLQGRFPYRVLFLVEAERVVVIRVLHVRRDDRRLLAAWPD